MLSIDYMFYFLNIKKRNKIQKNIIYYIMVFLTSNLTSLKIYFYLIMENLSYESSLST